MFLSDYEELKAQKKSLKKALKHGRISQEAYFATVQEIEQKITDYELGKNIKDLGIRGAKVQNGHYVIDLECPCGYKGTETFGKMDFKLLGKDRKGFLYFGCPECERHLQYDPITGKIRSRKGILGFLFGRFS